MKQVIIMPGGFHPFHAGHYALYQQAQDAFPGADVYVAATNDTSARPFPFAVKEKLAKLAGVKPGHFVQVKSPFQAREITANLDPENTQLIFVRSEKDANKPPQAGGVKKDGNPAYLQPYEGQGELAPMNKHAYMAYLPTVEFGPGMTSATEIRTAWPRLNEKRKTALVMSLYPKTQTNPALATNVVKMLDTAMGTEQAVAEGEEDALAYATKAHAGQTRSGGDPYITHPMRVADHIRKYKQSHNLDALISAAYLHDTIEDTSTTQEALHDLFGGLVASLVQELTSDPEQIKKMGKKHYLAHKMAAMSSYGLVIKLADRLDNVKDITTAKTPEWRAKYASETNHILDYIEKTRALSGTHRKLIELIRAKLAEIDNPQQSVDEGIFDRFKKKPAQPEVADPGNYPRIGSDIAQWMADTVEYHKAKFPDSVWKLFCPTYPDYLPVRVRVGTSEKIMHQHLEDYINLRNQNPEAVRIARQKFDKNNTYPSGPRDDYTTKVSEQGVAEEAPGMKDGRPYSDPLRRHPGNESYMTPEYLIQKYKERLAQIASGPYKRPKEVAQLQSRIAKLEKQGLEEAGFDKEAFRQQMRDLEAREELCKTDPVAAKALDLRGQLPQATKKKPEDDSIGINDPRHPGYAYTQMGQTDLNEFAPSDNGGSRKFIPWPEFIDAVKQIVGKDFSVTEKVIKSTIQDRFIPHDPMEYGPTMLYSYYEARAGRGKGAVSTRGSIQVGKYYPNNTALGKQNFITSFNLLKGHPFERHFDLTFDNIYKIANIILGNTEGAYQMPQQQGVAEDYVAEKK